jgi:hypothetical protein
MIYRRGVLPVLVLLVLVVVGGVLQIVGGSTSGSRSAAGATQTPTATTAAAAQSVLSSLAGVERAYDAGNVRQLCRPGVLVDPAVIRAQNARQGCQSELESLAANRPRLQVSVRRITLEPDLATATVQTGNGGAGGVDFVRRGRRWLLSFSDGSDPFPALAGTT